MAEIADALTTYLLAYSGLAALIGDRLYPDETPEDIDLKTQTAVIYQIISDVPHHHLSGQDSLARPIYQFTAFATTRVAARNIKDQLMLALNDYKGTLSGLVIQHIKKINGWSSVTKVAVGTPSIYTEYLEYEVNYERS